MHATSDTLEPPPGADAAAWSGDVVRDRVLALTSALRSGLDRLAGQRPDAAAIGALRGAGREIVEAGSGAQLAPLVRAAEGFCDLAAGRLGVQESAAAVDGLLRAVGVIEQVLDGCLDGMDADRLARLCDVVAARELGLDEGEDSDAIDLALDAAPRPAAAHRRDRAPRSAPAAGRPPHEQELFDAFAAEALDVLDQCEAHVLRCELDPGGTALDDVAADLATIRDAGAALGLHDLDAPPSGATVDALLDGIDAARERIEAVWADADAAAVDPAMLLPLDELFLRLRRTARDVARRHGGLIALETRGGELRVSAALADRVYEPLAQMIADAAAHGDARALRTLRLRAERDQRVLSLAIDEDAIAPDGAPADADRPEALHWIDARRAATDDDAARLVYRPGSVNVVQVITG